MKNYNWSQLGLHLCLAFSCEGLGCHRTHEGSVECTCIDIVQAKNYIKTYLFLKTLSK